MRKWLPLVAVCMGTFMLLVDVTIVNVALPDIAKDLKTSFTSLQWVVDAYALVLAALVLGIGAVGDRIGHRTTYIAGLILFAAASLVCGISPDGGVLIAARSVQGVGGAAMFATVAALINSNYSGRDRGTAFGLWGATAGASAAVGPILGGLLTEGISWRWIFFVNLPVSVLAVALCFRLSDANAPHKRKIDFAGIVVFSGAAAALTYAMIRANEDGWGDAWVLALFGAAVVLLALFAAVEAHSDHAMFDLALLRNRSFSGVLIAALALNFAAFSSFVYTSIWLQSVLGLSPIAAGATGLPLSIASFAVAAGIGRILHRAAPGPLIGVGMLLIGAGGMLELVLLRGSASWPALLPGFALIGVGVGLATPTLNAAALAAVPVQRGGMAGGAVNTGRQLGFALGIALLGTVFSDRAETTLGQHGVPEAGRVSRALAGGQAGYVEQSAPKQFRGQLDSAFHAASLTGLQGAFLVAGIVGLAAGVLVLLMVRSPGAHEQAAVGETAIRPSELDAVQAEHAGVPAGHGAHEVEVVGEAAVTPGELGERGDEAPAPV